MKNSSHIIVDNENFITSIKTEDLHYHYQYFITPPFANYNRAKLERLVQEGFEYIEKQATKSIGRNGFMSAPEFQLLVAADYYLRTTKDGR